MNPIVNEHVKIIFHSGLIEEGIVIEWSETQAVLKSISSDNLLLIQNTTRDVLAVKVYRDEAQVGRPNADNRVFIEPPAIPHGLETPEQSRENLKAIAQSREELRAMKLAELHKLRVKEEQARARELVTTFQPSGLPPVQYGLPGNIRQPVLLDPSAEDRRRDRGREEYLSRYQDRGTDTRGQPDGRSNSEIRTGEYPSGLLVPGYVRLPRRQGS